MNNLETSICDKCFETVTKYTLSTFKRVKYGSDFNDNISNKLNKDTIDEVLNEISIQLKENPIITIDELKNYKLLQIAHEKIKKFNEDQDHDFCIIDFWSPKEEIKLYALYVVKNEVTRLEYRAYSDKLNKLYKQEDFHNIIFDSNKIITRLNFLKVKLKRKSFADFQPFQPFTFIVDGIGEFKSSEELFLNYGHIKYLLQKNQYKDPEDFYNYIKEVYEIAEKGNGEFSVLKEELGIAIPSKVNEFFKEFRSDPVKKDERNEKTGEIKKTPVFKNPLAAFITYLHFFQEILPIDGPYKEYIYFPATAPVLGDNGDIYHRWIGGILYGFKNHTSRNIRINYQNFTQNIISSSMQLYQLFKSKEEEIKAIENAKRSAITQVMARNMSHNIGSHVLSRFKDADDLLEVIDCEEISKIKNKSELFSTSKHSTSLQYQARSLSLNNKLKEIDKLAYFNEYLKSRMDFLADVATTDPSMENPLFFLKDIINGLDKNRILLDRISGISGNINYDFIIRRRLDEDWKHLQYQNCAYDIPISTPNDILGCQAFYIIIENIIRNLTKHSKIEGDEFDFNIHIDINDYTENTDFYEVSIYDDLKRLESEINELVISRNNSFNNHILDPKSGRLRGEHLGTIEMVVCASYLRKLPFNQIENEIFNVNDNGYFLSPYSKIKVPNLIRAYKHQQDSEKYSLGYKLYLRKPQVLLIIDNSNSLDIESETIEKLRSYGIWILCDNSNKYKYDPEKNYGHDFLIWLGEKSSYKEFIKNNKGGLPKRKLAVTDFDEKIFSISPEAPLDTIKNIWTRYVRKMMQGNNISKILYKKGNDEASFEDTNKGDEVNVNFYDHGINWDQNALYPDLVCSHHRYHKLNLFNNESIQERAEYSESVLSKVIIIDERLQHNIIVRAKKYQSEGKSIILNDLFIKQKVILPTQDEADLNLPSFGELSNDLVSSAKTEADKIKIFVDKHIKNFNFCVLHLGILEKMLPINVEKSKGNVNEIIKKIIDDEYREKLIITSGRGKPNNLPNDISFVPLSILENAVEILFDKYLLIKLLNNSRRTL